MLEKMVKELAESVKKSVQTAIDVFAKALEPRLQAVEKESESAKEILANLDASIEEKLQKAIAAVPPAKNGEDGKSVELADVLPMIEAAVKNAVAEIPAPKNGENGEDGKSVDPDVLEGMIATAVAKRVAEIPAPKNGEDGKSVDPEEVKGMVAEAVAAIPPAKDGESVAMADVEPVLAEMVKTAVAAIELPKVENGRDALDLEILPLIDEAKSYARGVYATHRGGLWKSYKKTHGMNGWECIVDGIFKTVVNQVDERNFCFIVERASGSIAKLPFEVEATSYKKIYVAGQEYKKGDFVTWAGSLWHCNEKTKDKPGEGSEAWTLAAKKGRDYNPKVKV